MVGGNLSGLSGIIVVVCHFEASTFETTLDVESFVRFGAIKDALFRWPLSVYKELKGLGEMTGTSGLLEDLPYSNQRSLQHNLVLVLS